MEEEKKQDLATEATEEKSSTPEVFNEAEEGESELPPEIEMATKKDPTYVMNVGRPFRRTINNQKHVAWVDYRGKRFSVKVIMYRPGDDNAEADNMRLTRSEKCFVYYDGISGKVLGKKIKPVDFAFDIMDYPHVLSYPIGNDKYDERVYTIKCGIYNDNTGKLEEKPLPTLIENPADAERLLKEFDFLEECDKYGKAKKPSKYTESLKEKPKKSEGTIDWRSMEEVSDDKLPTKNKRSEGINVKGLSKLSDEEAE